MTLHRIHTASCRNVAKEVQEKLDVRLPLHVSRVIKTHLLRCPNCTAYLDSLKRTVSLFQNVPYPRLSGRLRKRLFAVLRLRRLTHSVILPDNASRLSSEEIAVHSKS